MFCIIAHLVLCCDIAASVWNPRHHQTSDFSCGQLSQGKKEPWSTRVLNKKKTSLVFVRAPFAGSIHMAYLYTWWQKDVGLTVGTRVYTFFRYWMANQRNLVLMNSWVMIWGTFCHVTARYPASRLTVTTRHPHPSDTWWWHHSCHLDVPSWMKRHSFSWQRTADLPGNGVSPGYVPPLSGLFSDMWCHPKDIFLEGGVSPWRGAP